MIHLDDHEDIAILRFEHGKANAVDIAFFDQLEARIDEALGSGCRALVLTGTGGIFSAGVDLTQVLEGGATYLETFLPALSRGLARVFTLDLPVVAALNGHALAGGCILAAACDFRLMAAGKGKVGVTELVVGVPFPATALETWRFLVPQHRAQELIMTGKALGVDEALAAGIIDEIVPAEELSERALDVARRLARIPSEAFALTKRQLRRPVLERLATHGAEDDARVLEIWSKPETLETIRAFMERTVKRKG